jgi:hypothetical protein
LDFSQNLDMFSSMTKLEQIEKAITALKPEEVSKLAAWFDEFQESLWDQQIAEDTDAGRLDSLAADALAAHKSGRTKPL